MKLQRKNRLRATALGALAVSGALVLTACGSDDNTESTGSGDKTAAAASNIKCDDAKGQVLAAGSSAQKNAMDLWVKNFQQACAGVEINYQPIGSGGGITKFTQGQVAFAGSDSALKPEEVTASEKICKGGKGINLPMVGGPVAIGFNVPGVDSLVLDAQTLAKIFDSKIKKWDDKAIADLNPDAKLPGTAIQAFHRSDESGTTQNLNKYLKAAAPAEWNYDDSSKSWEAKGGQAASGSSGVASSVKDTEGAIGYFELSYATASDLTTVKVDTGAGAPVEATTENASKAIAAAKVKGTGNDMALELDYATKAEGAYPIILVTYEIACDKGNKAETLPSVKAFLNYTVSDEGQKVLSEAGYAPLPTEIAAKVREIVPTLS
ncbi:phosphate ABC transporter substrate-binding protein PstS [Streptomyces sp. NP-1717]|uniref:phosphate ABC transporter substrate-binding protein PstS n=1 Tax=unclassified Streptomyces TaxID=2593676 RepID=UPI001F5E2F86|nr:phosphate ABC transporter substrate-binding protein PstS [Streptomyces sp. NP-1717]MCI3223055.1 phosphate ABC transporter substrate-binding protein PstS [Streptomyces sp. NP-1717]WTA74255.1 phosphate ABC transporter substrate-binding protein PstS [Streptomyces sp. NBC_00838]